MNETKNGMILICSDELDLRAVYYVQGTFFLFASFWGPRYMDLSWPFEFEQLKDCLRNNQQLYTVATEV